MPPERLPDAVHTRITALCERGNELLRQEDQRAAYESFAQAWEVIPEPKINWEASTWVLSALGDIMFCRQRYEDAKNLFLRAVQGPGGLGNPFIHLRIGQCQYELGNFDGAKENLTRAYMGGGLELFVREDPKYVNFLREFLEDVE